MAHARTSAGFALVAACRAQATRLVDQLHSIAFSSRELTRDRIRAIEILLERGYGKAPQIVALLGQLEQQVGASGLEQAAKAILAKRAQLQQGQQGQESKVIEATLDESGEESGEGGKGDIPYPGPKGEGQ